MVERIKLTCATCGWSKTNEATGRVPLEIHHIDGDWTNNRRSNLQALCPNRHSLTSTFRKLNTAVVKRKR